MQQKIKLPLPDKIIHVKLIFYDNNAVKPSG